MTGSVEKTPRIWSRALGPVRSGIGPQGDALYAALYACQDHQHDHQHCKARRQHQAHGASPGQRL